MDNVSPNTATSFRRCISLVKKKFAEHEYIDSDVYAVTYMFLFVLVWASSSIGVAVMVSGSLMLSYQAYKFGQFLLAIVDHDEKD